MLYGNFNKGVPPNPDSHREGRAIRYNLPDKKNREGFSLLSSRWLSGQKTIFIFFLVLSSISYSQALDDSIYNALDHFIENPTPTALTQLEKQETTFASQAKTFDEQLALVVLNSNIAYYHRQFSNNQKAIYYYEKAWSDFQKHQLSNYDIIEYCLKPLGNLYTIMGDFFNAENTIVSYLVMAKEQKNTPQIIAAIINLSVVYHNTGKHTTAIDLIQEGLKLKEISPQQKTALQNNLATNLMALKRFEDAQAALNNNATGDFNLQKMRNAAQLALKNNDFLTALDLLETAEAQLPKNELLARDYARFYVEKATVYSLMKQTQKATENYYKALSFLIPGAIPLKMPDEELLYAENTFLAIFDGLASLQNDPLEALRYYDLSFYVSHLLQSQYATQETKIIHQAALKKRAETCIEILYNQYQKTKDNNAFARAFDYAEKSKAAVLHDMVSQRSLLETHPDDPVLQKREQLSALQEQKINALLREQLTQARPEKMRVLNDTLSTISIELKDLQTLISAKYPDAFSKTISLNSLQPKVEKDNAVLVSYFFGKEALYRFKISGKEMRFHKTVVDESLSKSISKFINYFEKSATINNDIKGFTAQANLLFNLLLPKTLPKNKNLILIPDGLLHFIPFEALLTEPSQSTSFANLPFLIKQNSVSYNTSASLYYNAKTPDLKNSVLGVFPVFEESSQPLTFSLDEAKNLSALMDSRLLMRQEASKENFIAFAKAHSILHLSTHAYSGNFTIPAAMEFYDDVMLLQEFYSLNLNPKLVVLSACETGIGKIQSGEGSMSLARGFQYAGAQNLLFSLWKVNDLATSQLMASFYEHYSLHNSGFSASRHSKLDYLQNPTITNAKKSPYYWSSFVYYGALDESEKPKRSTVHYLAAFFIIFLFLAFYQKINPILFKAKQKSR